LRKTQQTKTAPGGEHLAGYLAPLRRFFRRRVTPDEADDLVQDVVTSLLARKAESQLQNTEAYVFTVARNALMRHQRQVTTARWRASEFDTELLSDEGPSAERSYSEAPRT
jgi:DNA-directed RNA polymerase specialized sigma24 family protein